VAIVAPGAAGPLLERADSLSVLGDALKEVSSRGDGQLTLVSGEAGIGKTALLRCFCEGLGDKVRLMWAACDPLFTPRPLGPLLDIGRDTGGLLQDRLDSGANPHDVAGALLDELSSRRTTVVVLEDIHWADEATLDVVRLVARRLEDVPALILVSYREEELHRVHPLKIVLGDLGAVPRIELRGLSPEAVLTLAADSALDARQLHDRTGGNPFFVTEALAAQTDRVPPSVRDAVLSRAARLSPATRELLDAVAVVPQRAEVWLLEALTDGALGALDDCLASGMLHAEADGVAFRHELARLSIEESLSPDRAVALHRRALSALAGPSIGKPDYARLAHHAEAAGDAQAVLKFAPAAAEEAAAVGSHWEAQAQYGRALRFAPRVAPEARADLLERYATEGYLTDMREEALDALDEALEIHRRRGNTVKQGEVQQRRSVMLVCIARGAEAREAASEAVQILEREPSGHELARSYSSLAEIAMRADEEEQAIHWGSRAIALAERVGDAEALVLGLNSVGVTELSRGHPEGLEKLERCLAVAKENGLTTEAGRAYINMSAALSHIRDWTAVDQCISAGVQYCTEWGLDAWLNYLIAARAESALVQGRWTEAADIASSILAKPASPVIGPRAGALLVLALVRARRGDPEYWPLLDEALEIGRKMNEVQFLGPIAAARAEAAWLEGRTAAIAEETETAFELALEARAPAYIGELACWRWRGGLVTEPPVGGDPFYRLQIAGEYEQAARAWREKNYPYEAALALADSDNEAALRQALDELQALGAAPAAAIVARRLRERGVRGLPRGPRRTTRENPAGLTARELDVLPLIAEGLRNAEIAQRLVVSEKTVDHHVSSILRKLDAKTRGEAAAAGARLGLIPAP
jgi:DNA-binding CsgD family transcriptional regulator/tetratricopeptide (TPR) repeat protein